MSGFVETLFNAFLNIVSGYYFLIDFIFLGFVTSMRDN